MILTALLMAAAAPLPADAPKPVAPQMRIVIRDLDFTRAEHIDRFVVRVRQASQDFCARHADVVTPDRLGDRTLCVDGMSLAAARALPAADWDRLVRSGRLRELR